MSNKEGGQGMKLTTRSISADIKNKWSNTYNPVCVYSLYKDHFKLTFVCPCIVSIIVNDDQQDATIFGLFIYS